MSEGLVQRRPQQGGNASDSEFSAVDINFVHQHNDGSRPRSDWDSDKKKDKGVSRATLAVYVILGFAILVLFIKNLSLRKDLTEVAEDRDLQLSNIEVLKSNLDSIRTNALGQDQSLSQCLQEKDVLLNEVNALRQVNQAGAGDQAQRIAELEQNLAVYKAEVEAKAAEVQNLALASSEANGELEKLRLDIFQAQTRIKEYEEQQLQQQVHHQQQQQQQLPPQEHPPQEGIPEQHQPMEHVQVHAEEQQQLHHEQQP